jgi:hypothetical protein
MSKQYFDISKIKLDETGRTVLTEESLSEIGACSQAGAGLLDDIEEWWDTNHGSCVNNFTCGDEINQESCTNDLDCSVGLNENSCFNDGCAGTTNLVVCSNTGDCDYSWP